MHLPKIKIENVTKIFGKKAEKALELLEQKKSKQDILRATGATVGVNNVSLSIEEGEIFVIMGLSGSGKSTLVRMFNRLIEPTKGNILIDGENLSVMDKKELRQVRREKMSMVFQNFGLFPHRTILENTEYGLEVQGVAKAERKERAQQALENSGLGDYSHQYPNQLSGGMQQRVGLARALANDPEILLMDEAFSALDPLIRREMQDELLDLQANVKKTIIFITHDLNEALRIGDRIALLKDGELVQIGTPEEILDQSGYALCRKICGGRRPFESADCRTHHEASDCHEYRKTWPALRLGIIAPRRDFNNPCGGQSPQTERVHHCRGRYESVESQCHKSGWHPQRRYPESLQRYYLERYFPDHP